MAKSKHPDWKDGGCGGEIAEELAHQVIGAAIEVHRLLGPGLPESVYEKALSHELGLRRVTHQCQAPVPVQYKDVVVGEGRMDLLVGARLVVELKACEQLVDLHRAQVRTYLSATGHRLALLINFNVAMLQDGIKRVLNIDRGERLRS